MTLEDMLELFLRDAGAGVLDQYAAIAGGDHDLALRYFYKCDEASRLLDEEPSGFMAKLNLKVGQIYDLQTVSTPAGGEILLASSDTKTFVINEDMKVSSMADNLVSPNRSRNEIEELAGNFILRDPENPGRLLVVDQAGLIRVLDKTPRSVSRMLGYVPQYPSFPRDFPISVEQVVQLGRINARAPAELVGLARGVGHRRLDAEARAGSARDAPARGGAGDEPRALLLRRRTRRNPRSGSHGHRRRPDRLYSSSSTGPRSGQRYGVGYQTGKGSW